MSRSVASALFVLALSGCAGARTEVVAPTATMPVSLSRGVRDADGVLVPVERQEVVGHFEQDEKAWGLAWTFVSLTPKTDFSAPLNAQVAKAHGDAVVRFVVRSKPCASNFVPILGWLPLWPGCSKLVAVGDIVRVKAAPAPPPAPVAKAAPPMPEPTPPPRKVASNKGRGR